MTSPTPDPSQESLSIGLSRLNALRTSDPGFYTLALHSFIESRASLNPEATREMTFREILHTWFRDHKESFPGLTGTPAPSEDELYSVLHAVIRDHRLTNAVRHEFARLTPEEARSATWNFLKLGDFTGWSALPQSAPLRNSLQSWDERASAPEDSEWTKLKAELTTLQSRSADIVAERESVEAKEKEILILKQQIALAPESPNIPEKQTEVRRLRSEIDTSDYRRYITGLSRFSQTSRTRRDFEKSIVRLSSEQQEALAGFTAEEDMLITGGAGTGKTLVLLEALKRTLSENSLESPAGGPAPHDAEKGKTTLITFTKTLVKYDRYLASLMAPADIGDAVLESSETFFWKKLIKKEPKHKVDYNLLRTLTGEMNTGVLTDAELYIEIEEYLFGLNITKEEYLEAEVPRKGLKTPLNLREREAVWAIRKKIEELMLSRNTYSKHFARLRLLGWLTHEDSGLRTHDHLFVDESQDMSAVELMCLKELSGKSLIMAGDTGQSIYGFVNPYRRANLELDQSRIRLLKINHRNTIPIHRMAEAFRRETLAPGEDPGPESVPFREGPEPEIHRMENPNALADLVAAKARMYVADLGYDAESVGILCSRTGHLSMMAEKLISVGLESAAVKHGEFTFDRRGVVRLSTLHSSKGLDFPVVLMYVPELPPAREIDPPYQERLHRNLQYVAMTRGMDVVERFESKGKDE